MATVEVGWRTKIRSRKTFQGARWQKSDPESLHGEGDAGRKPKDISQDLPSLLPMCFISSRKARFT